MTSGSMDDMNLRSLKVACLTKTVGDAACLGLCHAEFRSGTRTQGAIRIDRTKCLRIIT